MHSSKLRSNCVPQMCQQPAQDFSDELLYSLQHGSSKTQYFQIKKRESSYCKERPHTSYSNTHVSPHVCFGSHQSLAQPFAGAAALEATVISAGNCTGAIPTPEWAQKERFFDFNSPFLNS